MTRTIITPSNNSILIAIPEKYLGKEIEVLLYAKDELNEMVPEDITQEKPEESSIKVPQWQKNTVRKSIKKYQANPDLLIDEEQAWKLIDA